MAEPPDQTPAAAGHGHLRASHADREQVVSMLKAAYVQGRLGKDEFDLRVDQAFGSGSYAELAAVTADLPAGLATAKRSQPAQAQDQDQPMRRPGRRMALAAISVLAAMVTALALATAAAPGPPVGMAPVRPATVVAHQFSPFIAYATFGWLPTGYKLLVGGTTRGVRPADVLAFITAQRTGGRAAWRAAAGGSDRACRCVEPRRCAGACRSCRGSSRILQARGDVAANPVPRGLPTRRERSRPGRACRWSGHPPAAADPGPGRGRRAAAALRTHRDRAMVAAMVLGGLRRCEVLGLRLEDLRAAERRVFIAEGKGGHQRMVPVSDRFFAAVGAYLDVERPPGARTDRVFVVLKGPRRGQPLSAYGVDEILAARRRRAGLAHATCHELRHTCLTRLREAGMALEAVQAQAGHASIESTRIYLHLADDWLADQYRKAAEAIDAQVFADQPAGPGAAGELAVSGPARRGANGMGPLPPGLTGACRARR